MFIGDDNDADSQRFKLELEGENELVILGLNPSTARGMSKNFPKEKTCDDNTIKRIKGFSERAWNVPELKLDGFLMLNICAQSTSDSETLAEDSALHEKNKQKIESYLADKANPVVLLAYGDAVSEKKFPFLKTYLKEIVEIFKKHGATFYHLGDLTKEGNPRHPLFLPYNTPFNSMGENELPRVKTRGIV